MASLNSLVNELFGGNYRIAASAGRGSKELFGKLRQYAKDLGEMVTYPVRHPIKSLTYGLVGSYILLELAGCASSEEKLPPTPIIETIQTLTSTPISILTPQPDYMPAVTPIPLSVTPTPQSTHTPTPIPAASCLSNPDWVRISYTSNGADFHFYLTESKTVITSDGYPRRIEEIVDVTGSYTVAATFRDGTTRFQKGVLLCDNSLYEPIVFGDNPTTNDLMRLKVDYTSPAGKLLTGELIVYAR